MEEQLEAFQHPRFAEADALSEDCATIPKVNSAEVNNYIQFTTGEQDAVQPKLVENIEEITQDNTALKEMEVEVLGVIQKDTDEKVAAEEEVKKEESWFFSSNPEPEQAPVAAPAPFEMTADI